MTMELDVNLEITGNDNVPSFIPKLDLNNFEDPIYEGSKYVLTSPRSLEACSRFSVKPVDLLYKPLAEFQEELLPQDIPLRTIYNIYDEHEQARIRTLQLCREERYQIIATDPQIPNTTEKSRKNTAGLNTGTGYDKGSLQRRRTAWTTSIGHKRVSTKDIDDRANELHHESLKLKQELLSRKEGRVQKPKSARSKNASSNARNGSPSRTSCSAHSDRPASTRVTRSKISTAKSAVTIPETDRKIVELMKKKREAERAFYSRRRRARLAWDETQRGDERVREEAESRRRTLLAEESRIRDLKQKEKASRLKKHADSVQQMRAENVLDTSITWEKSFRRQAEMKEKQIAEKREKEKLRRSMQELNLKSSERGRDLLEEEAQRKWEKEISQVERRKETRSHVDRLKTMLENHKEREMFERRRDQVENQNREELYDVCSSVEQKHMSARSNLEKILHKKYHDTMLNQSKRKERLMHAHQSQEKMEDAMESWRSELTHRRKQMERRASSSVERQLNQTVQRVQDERRAREKEHKTNIKKIQKELGKWERSVRSEIQLKDMKSQILREEREATIGQTRAVAEATQKLRDEVRCKYDNETLVDKALQAEMYTKMGSGISSYVKNSSSLQFG